MIRTRTGRFALALLAPALAATAVAAASPSQAALSCQASSAVRLLVDSNGVVVGSFMDVRITNQRAVPSKGWRLGARFQRDTLSTPINMTTLSAQPATLTIYQNVSSTACWGPARPF